MLVKYSWGSLVVKVFISKSSWLFVIWPKMFSGSVCIFLNFLFLAMIPNSMTRQVSQSAAPCRQDPVRDEHEGVEAGPGAGVRGPRGARVQQEDVRRHEAAGPAVTEPNSPSSLQGSSGFPDIFHYPSFPHTENGGCRIFFHFPPHPKKIRTLKHLIFSQ